MKREPSAWGSALAAAALGLVIGTRHARSLLEEAVRRVDTLAGLPRPRAADWIEPLRPAVVTLGRLDALLELAAMVLAGWLVLQLVRLLNPRARLRVDAGPAFAGPWYTVSLDGGTVARAAVAAVASIYLFGGFRWLWQGGTAVFPAPLAWGLTGLMWRTRPPLLGLLLAFLAGGALIWLVWGELGVLSRSSPKAAATVPPLPSIPSADPPAPSATEATVAGQSELPAARDSTRRTLPGIVDLAVRGALAGLVALPLLLPSTELGRSFVGALLGVLSVTDARPWQLLAATELVWPPLALLLLTGVVRALGAPERSLLRRLALVLVPVVLAGAVAAGEVAFFRRVGRDGYGLGIPLAQALPELQPIAEGRAYLVVGPDGVGYSGLVPYGSIQGFAAGRDRQQAVWEYLRRHRYETPATSELFMHLYDSAAVDWDSAEILRVCLAELEGNPERVFAQLLLEKLATCAITPENRRALDALADPARFRFEGPGAQSMLAQLRRRFGEGGVPDGAAPGVGSSAAGGDPLREGVVTGRVLVQSRPLPGLRVGLVPAAQASTLPGQPRPFEHRHIAAATTADAAGYFRIPQVGEGDYLLIAMASDRDLPLRHRVLAVVHPPKVIHLDRRTSTRDLGTIDVALPPSQPGGQGTAVPGGPRTN
jgi:hypothetical protein